MQLLTFTVAGRRYGIDTRRVVEVLPLIAARPLPKQPNEVRGLIRYRGRMLPALDLSQLISEVRCRDRLGTRTIIVRLAIPASDPALLGLVAEDVVGIATAAPTAATPPETHGFLGPVIDLATSSASLETAQLINVDGILPDAELTALLGLAGQPLPGPTSEATA